MSLVSERSGGGGGAGLLTGIALSALTAVVEVDSKPPSPSHARDYSRDVASVRFSARENASAAHLVDMENATLGKIVIVLQVCCDEMDLLMEQARDRFMAPLLLYPGRAEASSTQDEIMGAARLLPLLQDVAGFSGRASSVVSTCLAQLSRVYSNGAYLAKDKEIYLNSVFRKIGDLLVCLLTLDEIISSKSCSA